MPVSPRSWVPVKVRIPFLSPKCFWYSSSFFFFPSVTRIWVHFWKGFKENDFLMIEDSWREMHFLFLPPCEILLIGTVYLSSCLFGLCVEFCNHVEVCVVVGGRSAHCCPGSAVLLFWERGKWCTDALWLGLYQVHGMLSWPICWCCDVVFKRCFLLKTFFLLKHVFLKWAPGWLICLSVQLLVLAQVMISKFVGSSPLHWQHGACLGFSVSLSLCSSPACSLSLFQNKY